MEMNENSKMHEILGKPITGTVLAVASGLSFFLLCMILPLVGPAGSHVEHAGQNKATFIMVLLVTLILAGLATGSKLKQRKQGKGGLPFFSLGLCALCILTFIILIAGGFSI